MRAADHQAEERRPAAGLTGVSATAFIAGQLTRVPRIADLGVLCALFLAVSILFADRKLLWTDELFTVYVAGQPSITRLLGALATGPDVLPPLNFLATRVSVNVLGDSHIAYRMAAVVGYLVGLIATYEFLRRRGRLAAIAGALTMMAVPAFEYAYEARPYGLLIGFTSVALLCWQKAAARSRPGWYLGLAAALGGAIMSHWYGVLAIVPIAAAEGVRSLFTRRIDVRMWCAIAAGSAVVLGLVPFARQAMSYRGMIPPPASLSDYILSAYQLVAGGIVLGAVLLLWAAYLFTSKRDARDGFRRAEIAAAVVTALLPVAGLVLARVTGGQSTSRYVTHATPGVAILLGLCMSELAGANTLRKTGAVVMLGAAVFVNVAAGKHRLSERSMIPEREGVFGLFDVDLPSLEPLPIVVPRMHDFLQLRHYAIEPLRSRLTYAISNNPMEARNITTLSGIVSVNYVDTAELFRPGSEFYVYETTGATDYAPLLPSLVATGALVSYGGPTGNREAHPRPGHLYRVSVR